MRSEFNDILVEVVFLFEGIIEYILVNYFGILLNGVLELGAFVGDSSEGLGFSNRRLFNGMQRGLTRGGQFWIDKT